MSLPIPRLCLLMIALGAGLIGEGSSAAAQAYPSKPVRLIVPFPPGGAVDAVARVVADRLSQSLGQQVVIDNRGGAGGTIGAAAAATAPADGYTLFIGTASTHGTNANLYSKLSYDPVKDFAPISLLVTTPFILVTHPAVPAKNAAELVALAKASPGKLNYGSYGNGSSNHLAAELFRAQAGIEIVHVPYRGAAPAIQDLMAGQIQFMFDSFPTSNPHIQAGSIRLIGVGGEKRSSLLPNVPTVAESGLAGYAAGTWFGLLAPAGTAAAVIQRLNRETLHALADPGLRERLIGMGTEPAGTSPAEFAHVIETEINKWAQLIRDRGIKLD